MISIISVNYNSRKYLEKLLNSIEKYLAKEDIEIIALNNEEKELKLKSTLPLKIIQRKKNIGFGSANNIGAQNAKGEWLLFVNPDVEFIDNSLIKAINFIKKHPQTGILGPQIIQYSTKKPQPWTSGKKTSLWQILFRNTFKKPWNKNFPVFIDWVSGTALLISKNDFEKIGGFDEAFFMYFEDQDLCLRIKELRKKTVFYPDFKIIHHNGKSWNKKSEQKKYYYESQDIFFKKHCNILSYKIMKIIRKIFKGK